VKRLLAFDTECTGLDRFDPSVHMFSFSTCTTNGETGVHRLDGSPVRVVQSDQRLQEILEQNTLIMHNAKFDIGMVEKRIGRPLRDLHFHDTSLMSRILRNDHYSHRLKDLTRDLAQYPTDDEKAVKRSAGAVGWDAVPEEVMEVYQRRDADRTMLLFHFLYSKLRVNPRWLEIYKNECELVPVAMYMEDYGVHISKKRCEQLILKCKEDSAVVREEMFRYVGHKFNPASPAFLSNYLFNDLKMPILEDHVTPSGKPSTAKETLNALYELHPNPFLTMLLKYRSWMHGASTLEGYLERTDAEGFIHPSINTCEAITGRLSCSNPNLMNVEKTGVLTNPYPVAARTVFTPRKGCVNFHIDYSGIEMRLLVHYAKEPQLVEILRTGGDVHEPATLLFWGDKYRNGGEKTRKTLRDASKNTNFAIPYGAGPEKLMQTLQVALSEAQRLHALYGITFPHLAKLNKMVGVLVRHQGYVETEFGRRLHVPKAKAYVGLNYLIQATATEILKRGMVRVHNFLREETGNAVRLLLPIHDELIIECPREWLKRMQEVLREVRKLMVDFSVFSVPLEVDFKVVTSTWEQKEKYKLYA